MSAGQNSDRPRNPAASAARRFFAGAGFGDLPRAWRIVLLLALMVLVSVIISVTRVSDLAGTSKAISLRKSLSWDLTSTAVWMILLPAIVRLAERLPLPSERPWRALAVHLAATAPFSLAHVLLMGWLRWALYSLDSGVYNPWWPLQNLFYEYRKDVLSYGSFVVFIWSWRLLLSPPPKPPAPPGEEIAPLEVRDGARRFYVRPSDIAWVEAAGNYVALHLAEREVLMRAPLSTLEARLKEAGFARIHRGRLVNRAQIASLAATPSGDFTLTLRDGRTLAGSRRYRQALQGSPAA